jgi:hypothetical protein
VLDQSEAEAAEAEAQQKRDEVALKTVNTKIAAAEKELLKMKEEQQSTVKARLALHSNENNPPPSKISATSSKQHPSTGFIVESKVCSVPKHGIYYHTHLKDAIAAGKIIGPHGHQQQLMEGYVKSMADQARTNVNKRRQNARITTHSYSVNKVKGRKEGVNRNQAELVLCVS